MCFLCGRFCDGEADKSVAVLAGRAVCETAVVLRD